MIIVQIKKNAGQIKKIFVSGHSGYAESGKDIVCAAVSAVTQTAILGIKDILNKQSYKVLIDDSKPVLSLELGELKQSESEKTQLILGTMMLGLKDIAIGNKKYLKLEEEDEIY